MRMKFLAAILLPWILAVHGPSGGAAAWSDSFDPLTTLDTPTTIQHPLAILVVAGQSGTCTKVRVYLTSTGGDGNVNMSLYDNSLNRIAAVANGVATSAPGWFEIPIAPVAVTGGTTYRVEVGCAAGLVAFQLGTPSEYVDPSVPWWNPSDPFPSGALTSNSHAVGMYIVP